VLPQWAFRRPRKRGNHLLRTTPSWKGVSGRKANILMMLVSTVLASLFFNASRSLPLGHQVAYYISVAYLQPTEHSALSL
jgi:hypothetical protein